MKLLGKTRNWNVVGPSKGGNFTYEAINSLVSGSEMRMYLKSESPAYVYMLGTGTNDKKILKLFPIDGISPALNYSNSEVALPSEEHYFKMDNTTGENYIIILFSKTKLDINKISQDMGNGNGTVNENLEDTVGNILISSDNTQFKKK